MRLLAYQERGQCEESHPTATTTRLSGHQARPAEEEILRLPRVAQKGVHDRQGANEHQVLSLHQ